MSVVSLAITPVVPSMSSVVTTSTPSVVTSISNLKPDKKRSLLFDWSLVSNIWIQWDSYKYANGDTRKTFACRFIKHRESSTQQKENSPNEKRRITKIRPSGLCLAKIKVSWIVSSKVVQVKRYNNSSNHTHSLIEIDRIKQSKAVRSLVEKEAVKNSPPAITAAVKEYATVKLDLGECVCELKCKEVTNIKYKVRGLMEVHLIGNSNLKLDILESISYLMEQRYQVENYRVPQRSTKGIVFVHPEQLKKLERYGWLMLIDSTHKTNRYDWRLFTLYVCDTYGCWDVGAHFFVNNHSNIEAKGIKKAFSGIIAGLWARQHFPLLLQVTSTNPLESFHSKLKRITSSLHGLIGVTHNIVNIDYKKRSESESVAFNFRIKKVSAYDVDNSILEKIHKFPFPFQNLIIKEACVIMCRIEKGKGMPGLTSLDCHCLFCNRYLLPCKHIFHEHLYECGAQTEQQKSAENRRLVVAELTERVRDRYWSVEETGNIERTETFVSMLEVSLNPIILQFDQSKGKN
ncbi:hypothetical protein Glove_299g115 [Diversispora epigaea]|uniref:ZSWIM1/3 RNaseH-like domain-containing protein n=1 Tax=Diversispora epigaea TaxID=1348612 RepID=A0A397HYE7_9GLOM|nr:hypothetical protein Glove_299g115 [Diversispora epigaea]